MAVKALTPPGAWAWGTIPLGGGGDWETGSRAHIYIHTYRQQTGWCWTILAKVDSLRCSESEVNQCSCLCLQLRITHLSPCFQAQQFAVGPFGTPGPQTSPSVHQAIFLSKHRKSTWLFVIRELPGAYQAYYKEHHCGKIKHVEFVGLPLSIWRASISNFSASAIWPRSFKAQLIVFADGIPWHVALNTDPNKHCTSLSSGRSQFHPAGATCQDSRKSFNKLWRAHMRNLWMIVDLGTAPDFRAGKQVLAAAAAETSPSRPLPSSIAAYHHSK